MASASSPRERDLEQSFSLAAGHVTEAERLYLRQKGLVYDDSNEDSLDISTDVGSMNSSSRSNVDSLIIFEEIERLYGGSPNRSRTNNEKTENSPMKIGSSSSSLKTPEKQLGNTSKGDGSYISPGYTHPNFEEEDKENEFKGPMSIQRRLLFQDELDHVRDPLEEIKGIAEHSSMTDYEESEKSQDDASQIGSEDELCVVPCTQDVEDKSIHSNVSSDDIDVVPCSQALNETSDVNVNLNKTYVSEILEESLAEELAPCTQAYDVSNSTTTSVESEVSRIDISSVPCSQSSSGETSTKDELNDTIAIMEKLLKLADEQEEKEKNEAEEISRISSPAKVEVNEPKTNDNFLPPQSLNATDTQEEIIFKTPLKHSRVKLLRTKKVASPSPPRSFANALLQQRTGPKVPKPVTDAATTHKLHKPPVRNSPAPGTPSPINTSTPKRNPLAAVTPVPKKNHTPGRTGVFKTPVAAKVDSGLRPSALPIGLSPVAHYIYDKPVPSKFARVQSIPNPKAALATASVSNTSISRIPLPPPRLSQLKPKTPASDSKQNRHSVLRTSTYFNMTSTPPVIVGNEKSVVEKKRFQPLQYTGSTKVKALNGTVESPKANDYVAHRHMGLRDESGNASFIQNSAIQKHNVPLQSRLATPKNGKETCSSSPNTSLFASPVREKTFTVSE